MLSRIRTDCKTRYAYLEYLLKPFSLSRLSLVHVEVGSSDSRRALRGYIESPTLSRFRRLIQRLDLSATGSVTPRVFLYFLNSVTRCSKIFWCLGDWAVMDRYLARAVNRAICIAAAVVNLPCFSTYQSIKAIALSGSESADRQIDSTDTRRNLRENLPLAAGYLGDSRR